MEPISGSISGAAYAPPAPAGTRGTPEERRPEGADRSAPGRSARDEYVPERRTVSTDRVDREIEALRRTREELKQRLGSETDADRIRELEKKLSQVERELRQKDNDAYRRQHAAFS